MNRRVYRYLCIIALLAALIAGVIVAWLPDDAMKDEGAHTAGSSVVEVGAQSYTAPYTVALDNIAPGDVVTGTFTVANIGPSPLSYAVTANTSGPLFDVAGALVTITANGEGTMLATDPADFRVVTFTVILPKLSGNAFRGATGTLSFTVVAVTTTSSLPQS